MAEGLTLRIIVILTIFITTIRCNTAFNDVSERGKSNTVKAFSDVFKKDESNNEKKDNLGGGENQTDLSNKCTLKVREDSKKYFSAMILHNKYNFVYLNLEFINFSIAENDEVIEYKRWVWTYKGEKGGYQNLFLPNYYGYLSFGLLWTHTYIGPMRLTISSSGMCKNLTSGDKTDALISGALGDMTNEIATQDDIYYSSYWCYTVRIKLHSIGRFMCKNTGCPYQTFGHKCCLYIYKFNTQRREIKCNDKPYHLGSVWWTLVIYLGNLFWVNFPLLLTYLGYKFTKATKKIEADAVEMDNVLYCESERITKEYVFFDKHRYPITVLGTIKQALCFCKVRNTIVWRLLRFTIIFLPLAILMLKVLITLKFEGNFIRAAGSKKAQISFNSLLLGFQTAQKRFLVIFGGPHIAFSLYVLLSCILIQLPRDLESFLAGGSFNHENLGLSPLTLTLETKCRLAGLQCGNMSGFKKLHYTLASNMLLLLNMKFWKCTFKNFLYRWKTIFHPGSSHWLVAAICIPLIAVYVIFCIFELAIMLLHYIFPIVMFPHILFKAYVTPITKFTKHCSNTVVKALFYIFIPVIILALAFTWYMYCLTFGGCIWYFIIIILYTYSGIIAYPRISYGYLILVFMTIYYIVEIFNKFGKSYQKLLHITIKACRKVNQMSDGSSIDIQNDNRIPQKLWELVVERHQARRLKIAATVIQLAVLISVLSVSVNLLQRFEQFQELSVITHVFTVLVVCALPKIIRSVYIDKLRGRNKHRLLKEVEKTVQDFLEDNIEDNIQIYRSIDHDKYEEI